MMGPSAGADHDIKGLFSLLEIVGDPDKAKLRLEEFAKVSVEAKKLRQEAQESIKKNTTLLQEINEKLRSIEEREAALQKELNSLVFEKQEVASLRLSLEGDVSSWNKDVKDTTQRLEKKEEDLRRKEEVYLVSLRDKEQELREKIRDTAAQGKEYIEKMNALRLLVK